MTDAIRRVACVAILAAGCLVATAGASGHLPDAAPAPWPAGTPVSDVLVATDVDLRTAFSPELVSVDRSSAVRLVFENVSELDHNLVFTAGTDAASHPIVAAHSTDVLLIAPLPPGRYPFSCTIHEEMTGVLVVG